MPQNIYDDGDFFGAYLELDRSVHGLDGAPEWPALRNLLPPMSGRRVVDLGCGLGWFARWADAAGAASVLGVDLSERMLAGAADRTTSATISYRRGDLDTIELPASSFDLAFSSLTLHYLVDLPRLMRRVHDSLTPGSAFVFSCEHPILTAPSTQTFRTDEHGTTVWPLNDYQREGRRVTDWLAPGVVKYHRTMGTIVESLLSSEFALDALIEWAPSPEDLAEHPEWITELDRPMFLIVRATRI